MFRTKSESYIHSDPNVIPKTYEQSMDHRMSVANQKTPHHVVIRDSYSRKESDRKMYFLSDFRSQNVFNSQIFFYGSYRIDETR